MQGMVNQWLPVNIHVVSNRYNHLAQLSNLIRFDRCLWILHLDRFKHCTLLLIANDPITFTTIAFICNWLFQESDCSRCIGEALNKIQNLQRDPKYCRFNYSQWLPNLLTITASSANVLNVLVKPDCCKTFRGISANPRPRAAVPVD